MGDPEPHLGGWNLAPYPVGVIPPHVSRLGSHYPAVVQWVVFGLRDCLVDLVELRIYCLKRDLYLLRLVASSLLVFFSLLVG
jgi:hypothetical protein